MKKIGIKIALFILPFVVFISVLEIGLGRVQDSYSVKAELFYKNRSSIETWFLGASPTAYGIDPSFMKQKAFNMGNFYQFLNQDTSLVISQVSEMKQLKLVVFNLIPPIMELDGRGTNLEHLSYEYHQLYGTGLDRRLDWFDLRAYSKIALFGYRNSVDYMFRGFKVSLMNDVSFSEQGFVSNKSIETVTYEADDKARKDQLDRVITPYQNEGHWEINRQKLEAAIEFLLSKKVSVAIIISPVTPQYSAFYNKSYQDTKEYVNILHTKYSIKTFDYFLDHRFNGEDFRDFLHLNSQGAVKWSQFLTEEVMPDYYDSTPSIESS